jgi:plastocyanin
MNKKLVGGIIAVLAVAALIIVFVVTRPEKASDTATTTDSSSGHSDTSGDNADAASEEAVETNKVAIKDFDYAPGTITVKKGTTVTWTNEDSVAHTVTGENGGPDSELLDQGQSYSFTFNEAGTFEYFCKPHPNMVGSVIVEE